MRIVAAVLLHGWRIHGDDRETGRFLAPTTQRAYSRMLIALVLCLSVLPMAGFWIDARDAATAQFRRQALVAIVGPGGEIEANEAAIDGIRHAFALHAANTGHPGQFGVDVIDDEASVNVAGPFAVARTLSGWSNAKHDTVTPRACSPREKLAASPGITVCGSDAIYIPGVWRWEFRPAVLSLVILLLRLRADWWCCWSMSRCGCCAR